MLKLVLEQFEHKRSSTKLISIYKCSELKNEFRLRKRFRLPLPHVGHFIVHSIIAGQQDAIRIFQSKSGDEVLYGP